MLYILSVQTAALENFSDWPVHIFNFGTGKNIPIYTLFFLPFSLNWLTYDVFHFFSIPSLLPFFCIFSSDIQYISLNIILWVVLF